MICLRNNRKKNKENLKLRPWKFFLRFQQISLKNIRVAQSNNDYL